jgi:integrase
MTLLTPAAAALVDALKDPTLTAPQRLSLVAALQAVTGPPAVVQTATTTKSKPRAAAEPDNLRTDRVLLTKTAINAMPLPAAGERLVYDEQTPQLAVRLRPTGRTYIVSMWDRARRRRVSHTIGRCINVTPEQARAQAQRLVGQLAGGDDIRRSRAEGLTVRQLVEQWHAEKSKAKRTADEMRDKALDYLGKIENMPVPEVTREHIGGIHHHLATKARRRVIKRVNGELRTEEIGEVGIPATADKWLAIMSSVFGWATTKGLAATNPCKGIKKAFNAKEAARQTYLHGDALLRFWKALEADPDEDVRDVLLLALFTGQRKGNVLSMRWDDVDLAAGRWTIPAEQTKQKKEQTNPLSSMASVILQRRYQDAGTQWVFPAVRRGVDGEIGRMSETRPREAWERICKAAQLDGVRIHDLRHTAGSWLARLGANEAVRQKALGHQTPQMAARYSHLELDPIADAMQRMGDAITAAATKQPAAVRAFKKG